MSAWDWHEYAACRGEPLELFFGRPREDSATKSAREAVAKRICDRCEARLECGEYAIQSPEQVGVWGGLGEDERAKERRRRMRRAANKARAGAAHA